MLLNLDEAKEKYKGCTVKDKGYHPDTETQFLFRSEVMRKAKIICLFQGIPHILPTPLQDVLKTFVETKQGLPSDVFWTGGAVEKFTVPAKYFVRYDGINVPTATPVIPDPVSFNTKPFVGASVFNDSGRGEEFFVGLESDPLFQKVKEVLAKVDMDAIKSLEGILPISSRRLIENNIESLSHDFICQKHSENILIKLITNLLLLNKIKNVESNKEFL